MPQREHERSQSRLFELEASREELTAATQLDADLEEEQSQRTQRLLGYVQDVEPGIYKVYSVEYAIHKKHALPTTFP